MGSAGCRCRGKKDVGVRALGLSPRPTPMEEAGRASGQPADDDQGRALCPGPTASSLAVPRRLEDKDLLCASIGRAFLRSSDLPPGKAVLSFKGYLGETRVVCVCMCVSIFLHINIYF